MPSCSDFLLNFGDALRCEVLLADLRCGRNSDGVFRQFANVNLWTENTWNILDKRNANPAIADPI